jgi:hypothetical protein
MPPATRRNRRRLNSPPRSCNRPPFSSACIRTPRLRWRRAYHFDRARCAKRSAAQTEADVADHDRRQHDQTAER